MTNESNAIIDGNLSHANSLQIILYVGVLEVQLADSNLQIFGMDTSTNGSGQPREGYSIEGGVRPDAMPTQRKHDGSQQNNGLNQSAVLLSNTAPHPHLQPTPITPAEADPVNAEIAKLLRSSCNTIAGATRNCIHTYNAISHLQRILAQTASFL